MHKLTNKRKIEIISNHFKRIIKRILIFRFSSGHFSSLMKLPVEQGGSATSLSRGPFLEFIAINFSESNK